MCGRFTNMFKWRELQVLMDLLDWTGVEIPPRYNLAPTQQAPVVRATGDGSRHGAMLRWGLVPSWADDLSIGSRMINARAETLAEKPAFRHAFARRRCLVPISGFYEWKAAPAAASAKKPGSKQPYYIVRQDRRPFVLAGLWESCAKVENPAGPGPLETFTLITTTPNRLLSQLHDRMPVILDPVDYRRWLDPSLEPDAIRALLKPYAGELRFHAIGKRITSRTDNSDVPETQEPVVYPELALAY